MSENIKRIPWSKWRIKAQNSYVKGKYTAQDMIRDWGYPSDWDAEKNKILFRKGVPGLKSRKTRKDNRTKYNSNRQLKSNISTKEAYLEGQKLDALHKTIKDEASLFRLTNPEIEELFIEHDISINSFNKSDFDGASNDPDNRYLNGKLSALPKNEAEEFLRHRGLDRDFIVFTDSKGEYRIENTRKYDRVVDPFQQGKVFNSLDEVKAFVDSNQKAMGLPKLQDALASATKRAGEKIARNLVPGVGTAMDIQDTKQRFEEFVAEPNLMNGAQLANQAVSSGANVISDIALATGVGAPVAALAEKVSGLTSITDVLLQGTEDYIKGPSSGQ